MEFKVALFGLMLEHRVYGGVVMEPVVVISFAFIKSLIL